MCALDFALVAIILIVLVWVLSRGNSSEHFDVYENHERGAQKVYETTGVPFTGKVEDLTLKEAGRLARYTWSEADPLGLNVYDRYYERFVGKNKYANQYPDTASDDIPYRDIGDDIGVNDVYDVKFHVYSGQPGIDGYSSYSITGMADPDPLYMEFNGDTIVLNQKNF
jgi:hypothetical protein